MSFGNSYKNGVGLVLLSQAERLHEPSVDLIFISTAHLVKAREWAISQRDIGLGNVNIWAFEPWTTVDDQFSWSGLFKHGQTLVNILAARPADPGGRLRPIVLLAHSLAGFILKQTLVLVHQQLERYEPLRAAIKGVVLMGCPHTAASDRRDTLYDRAVTILQLKGTVLSSRVVKALKSCNLLTEFCSQFDRTVVNVPVLTVYETKPTKTSRKPFQNKSLEVVDKDLATIGCNLEQREGVSTDHGDLPSLHSDHSKHGFDERSVLWLKNLVGYALSRPRAKPVLRSINSLKIRDSSPATIAGCDREHIPLKDLIEVFTTPRPLPRKLPCFGVDISRQRNKNFFGRGSVINRLDSLLIEAQSLVLLYGMGGVGKSEVALNFVHKHVHDFDAILWMQADDVSKLRHAFGGFAARLGLEEGQVDPYRSRELVKAWLMDPIKRQSSDGSEIKAKWLIVFDGADDPKVLSEFAYLHGRGSVLITSRNPATTSVFPGVSPANHSANSTVEHVNLELFSDEEGATILKSLAEVEDDGESELAKDIAHRLDGWPLAINQMATIIRSQQLTLTEFSEQYNDPSNHSNIHAQLQPGAKFETMVSSMRLARLSAPAVALLRICSVLDADGIQEILFTISPGTYVDLENFPSAEPEMVKARTELIGASLLQRNGKKQELWMHRVVQDTVRSQCSKSVLNHTFATAATLVKRAWQPPSESVRDNLKIWEPCAAYLGHVLQLQHIYELVVNSDNPIRPSADFAWLLNEVSCFQRNLGHTAGLKRTLDLALSICQELPRKDTINLLEDIFHGLGAWANETNHPEECMDYNEKYLKMRLDTARSGSGPDERTAAAWNQYGTGLMMVRRTDEAMEAFEKSRKMYSELSIDTPCPDSLPIVNLAVAKILLKKFDEASALLEEGRLQREEAFGYMDTDSFRTGRFYHALGNVCWEQGKLRTSEIWHRRALTQYTSSLGTRHHRTADVRHRVAMHCLQPGSEDHGAAALALINQALESWRMDPDSFGPEIARTTWLKARQQDLAGDRTAAAELRQQAADMRRTFRPDDLRSVDQLKDEDFDDLVAFWSR